MLYNKKIILIFILLPFIITSSILAKNNNSDATYLDKFHAHEIVYKLKKTNLLHIRFIDIIANNFGYADSYKLRKDYWSANLLVTKGDIINAQKLLEKNKVDIIKALNKISKKYQKDTQLILNDCASKLSDFQIKANIDPTSDEHKKIIKNQERIQIAFDEFNHAIEAFYDKRYKSSINHYRSSKGHAIKIMKELVESDKKQAVIKKYIIHIVDNRHGVFKKS